MALDKNDLNEIKSLLDQQTIFLEKKIDQRVNELQSRTSLDIKLALSPLHNALYDIQEELKRLNQRETGDIGGAYEDIVDLKKRLTQLEHQMADMAK